MGKKIHQLKFYLQRDEKDHDSLLESLLYSLYDKETVQRKFICPVSLKPFRDPVKASDGLTYDRQILESAQNQGEDVYSCVTGDPIDLSSDGEPNLSVARELNDVINNYNKKRRKDLFYLTLKQLYPMMIKNIKNMGNLCKKKTQEWLQMLTTTLHNITPNVIKKSANTIHRALKRGVLQLSVTLQWLVESLRDCIWYGVIVPVYIMIKTTKEIGCPSLSVTSAADSIRARGASNEPQEKREHEAPLAGYVDENDDVSNSGARENLTFKGKRIRQFKFLREEDNKNRDEVFTGNPQKNQKGIVEEYLAKKGGELAKKNVHDFVCPISQSIFLVPVRASDGFVYEKSSIISWMNVNRTSPQTRAALTNQLTYEEEISRQLNEMIHNHNKSKLKMKSALNKVYSSLESDGRILEHKVETFLNACTQGAIKLIDTSRAKVYQAITGQRVVFLGNNIKQDPVHSEHSSRLRNDDQSAHALQQEPMPDVIRAFETETRGKTVRDYTCPLSQRIYTEPVIGSDGVTYERSEILAWYTKQCQSKENKSSGTKKPGQVLSPVNGKVLETIFYYNEQMATEMNEMINNYNVSKMVFGF